MPYYFGIYHWRRRGHTLLGGLALLLAAAVLWRRGTRHTRWIGLVLAVLGFSRASDPVSRVLDPPPWTLDRTPYDRLGSALEYTDAATVLDVGCGTGRSIVGLAPHIPDATQVTAVDVFDDRVILGNGPRLAARNAARAGVAPAFLQGDATALPVGTNTQDVLTISRVLHDLPSAAAASTALGEAHRVLSPDGHLGVIELPITHDDADDPERYWVEHLTDAGFRIEDRAWTNGYFVLTAAPA